jgi:hypothetical protein
VFGVVFRDVGELWPEAVKDFFGGWGDVGPFLELNMLFGSRGADLWIGYSQGGAVVFEALRRAYRSGMALPRGAILIEPFIPLASSLPSGLLQSVRVITWADRDWTPMGHLFGRTPRGWIVGAFNFRSDDCGGLLQHCVHSTWQDAMVTMAHVPTTPSGDAYITDMARTLDLDYVVDRGPQPVPLPRPP